MTSPVAPSTERRRPVRESVAEEIRSLMARRRMTGVTLALRIERSQSYVSRRLTGETAFDTDDLENIADALGVKITDLLPREHREVTVTDPLAPRVISGPGIPDRRRPRPGRPPQRSVDRRPAPGPRQSRPVPAFSR